MTIFSNGTLLRWRLAMLMCSTIACSSLRFSLSSYIALVRINRLAGVAT